MSVSMFLRLEGVAGGSRNYSYKGWSEVLSWQWEMFSNRTAPQISDKDHTSFGEISLVKPIGMDSTAIRTLYARGDIIPSAELSIIPVVSKREAKQKYLAMKMEKILIKSIVTAGSSDEDHFNETVVLLFNNIRFEYNLHTDASPGETSAASVDYEFAWDIAQNREWAQTAP